MDDILESTNIPKYPTQQDEDPLQQDDDIPVHLTPSIERPLGPADKLHGYDFYRQKLGSARLIVAPMVCYLFLSVDPSSHGVVRMYV